MNKNNKFEFEENEINVEQEIKEEEKNKESDDLFLDEKAEKRRKLKKYMRFLFYNFLGTAVIIAVGLIWQDAYDLMAWSNAVLLAFAMVFFVGWIMLMHNKNILSVFTHSMKTFGLMIVGKRPAKSYYEVKVEIEENPIPKIYLIIIFSFSILLLIATIILTVLVL